MAAKWFYPLQKKLGEYLHEKYGTNYSCNYQDVCKDRVHENYNAWDKDGKLITIHVVMSKNGFFGFYNHDLDSPFTLV